MLTKSFTFDIFLAFKNCLIHLLLSMTDISFVNTSVLSIILAYVKLIYSNILMDN